MTRNPTGVLVVAWMMAAGPAPAWRAATQDAPSAPTRVVRYVPPSVLPERTVAGTCRATSRAAWFRDDAWQCVANATTYDPCFVTRVAGRVLCGVDPRQPASGILVSLSAPVSAIGASPRPGHHVWFFELADGSTCQPLPSPGRELEGAIELYGCRFGSAGQSDAVLGDLDTGDPIWTIRKVLINKKTDPQTIKSLTMASVRTVWQ